MKIMENYQDDNEHPKTPEKNKKVSISVKQKYLTQNCANYRQ
jgi:hypothetical protein